MLPATETSPVQRALTWLAAIVRAIVSTITECGGRRVTVGPRSLRVLRTIAEGGYGTIYCVTDGRGSQYALKELVVTDSEGREAVRAEIQAHLAFPDHPHLLPLVDYSFDRRSDGREVALLLLPLMAGTAQDLLSANYPRGPFYPEPAALRITLQIAKGLHAMHLKGRSHRDVCPRNILLTHDGVAVLTDFGSVSSARITVHSRLEGMRLVEEASVKSSMPFRAPELWEAPEPGTAVTEAADVWSLGCSLYALAFGCSPFECVRGEDGKLRYSAPSHVRVLGAVVFPVGHGYSHAFVELISRMTTLDAAARVKLPEVITRIEGMLGVSGSSGSSGGSTVSGSATASASGGGSADAGGGDAAADSVAISVKAR